MKINLWAKLGILAYMVFAALPLFVPAARPYLEISYVPSWLDMVRDFQIEKYRAGVVCWAISSSIGFLGATWVLGAILMETFNDR